MRSAKACPSQSARPQRCLQHAMRIATSDATVSSNVGRDQPHQSHTHNNAWRLSKTLREHSRPLSHGVEAAWLAPHKRPGTCASHAAASSTWPSSGHDRRSERCCCRSAQHGHQKLHALNDEKGQGRVYFWRPVARAKPILRSAVLGPEARSCCRACTTGSKLT